ncbi:MAG: hypothetical protein PVH82_16960, partial [Desulfobacteraceae bacterium]
LPTPLRKKALAQQRQIFDIYYHHIDELKKKGFTNDVDETVVTFCIFATMNWAYRWFRDRKRLSIEEVAEDMIRILFSGILRDEVPYAGQKGVSP